MNKLQQSFKKNSKRVKYAPSRCYSMCLDVCKKMGKISHGMRLVETDIHYWLEDKEGNIYDIYSDVTGEVYDYNMEIKMQYEISQELIDSIYVKEKVWGGNGYKEEMVNVYSFDLN